MTLDLTLTTLGFTVICVLACWALGAAYLYNVFKNEERLMELGMATLMAEIFIFCMWLVLCGGYNS
jgi:hypothetical protein